MDNLKELFDQAAADSKTLSDRRGTFTCFLPSGASAQLAMPQTEGVVAAEFKAADVEQAVREAQRKAPGCTYSGFCTKVKAAGCAGYRRSTAGADHLRQHHDLAC
jgi:hypothetical protein